MSIKKLKFKQSKFLTSNVIRNGNVLSVTSMKMKRAPFSFYSHDSTDVFSVMLKKSPSLSNNTIRPIITSLVFSGDTGHARQLLDDRGGVEKIFTDLVPDFPLNMEKYFNLRTLSELSCEDFGEIYPIPKQAPLFMTETDVLNMLVNNTPTDFTGHNLYAVHKSAIESAVPILSAINYSCLFLDETWEANDVIGNKAKNVITALVAEHLFLEQPKKHNAANTVDFKFREHGRHDIRGFLLVDKLDDLVYQHTHSNTRTQRIKKEEPDFLESNLLTTALETGLGTLITIAKDSDTDIILDIDVMAGQFDDIRITKEGSVIIRVPASMPMTRGAISEMLDIEAFLLYRGNTLEGSMI